MAITKSTAAQTIQTYTTGTTLLADGYEAAHILRLENGRMAISWETEVGGTTDVLNITTLDALALNRSPVVTADSVAATRGFTHVSLAPMLNTNVMAAWSTDSDVPASALSGDAFGRQFSTYGASLANKFNLSVSPAGGESSASIVRLGTGLLVSVWSDTGTSTDAALSTSIFGRLMSATGTIQPAEFVLSTSASQLNFGAEASALGDGRAVVVWAAGHSSPEGVVTEGLKGHFIGGTGSGIGTDFAIDTLAAGGSYDTNSFDIVSLGNGGFAVVWREIAASGEQVHVQRMNAAGAKVGGEIVVDSVWGSAHVTHVFTTELAHGGFAVGWGVTGGTGGDVQYVRQYAMTGAEIGTKTSLNTLGGTTGLTRFDDLELMSDGRIAAFGTKGTLAIATQIFDFGTKVVNGTSLDDTLYGHNSVNDTLIGSTGSDKLFGLSGNDLLNAGAGNDVMTGGLGNDTYVFNTALGNRDTITDYTAANDTIELENAVFTKLGTKTGTLSWIMFQATATGIAKDPDDRILYNTTTGVVSYDPDGTGAAAAIPFAVLSNKPYISAIEFHII